VPGTILFCHKMSLEQNTLACPIILNNSIYVSHDYGADNTKINKYLD